MEYSNQNRLLGSADSDGPKAVLVFLRSLVRRSL